MAFNGKEEEEEEEAATWENIFRLALNHLSLPITRRLTNVSIYFHAGLGIFSTERPCVECVKGCLCDLTIGKHLFKASAVQTRLPMTWDSMNYLFGQH